MVSPSSLLSIILATDLLLDLEYQLDNEIQSPIWLCFAYAGCPLDAV